MENKKSTEAKGDTIMKKEDFAALWKSIRLKVTDTYDVPPEILWVNGSTIGTLGNFSASTGKAKSKKTFNISAIVAAALTNDEVLHYSACLPPDKRKILYVDTEQSRYHCHKVMERILRLAGLPTDQDRDDFVFIVLREQTPDMRKRIIEYMLENMPDVGLLIIDGIRDLMYDTFEVRRVLVVAPLRVARDTWPEEIRKWDHLKDLTCSVVVGNVAERRRALQQEADIYIVNRENLAWLYQNSCLDFDMVVLDELSSFKNHQSKRFRAMKALRPRVKRIVGLTGTPSGNGLMDLWAEFRILDMGKRLLSVCGLIMVW